MAVTFSGLYSGIDSAAIIEALVRAERQPITSLNQRKAAAGARASTLGDIITRLKALQNESRALDQASEVRAFTISVSDEGRVRVSTGGNTTPGSYAITVNSLASAQTSRSQSYASDTAGAAGAGAIAITVGTSNPVTVTYDENDSLSQIAARINGQVPGVNAYVLDSGAGYHLVVSGRNTGAAHTITFSESGDGLAMTQMVAAADASITIDNMTITRPTNSFTEAVAGLTIDVLSVTPAGTPATNVTVTADLGGQRAKVQKLVDQFNAVVNAVNSQLSYTGRVKGENTLFGDATLRGLQGRLSDLVTRTYAHGSGATSPAQAGLTLNADGTLRLDAAKFEKFVKDNPTGLEELLAGETGLARTIAGLVDEYAAPGTGHLITKQNTIRSQQADFDRQIARVERRASGLAEALQRQFNNLETTMARLQTQQNYLISLLR